MRILDALSFLMEDEHPQALKEYLPDSHSSVIRLFFFFFFKVMLAFKGQFNQWRSPSFAEHQGILHSKYELTNLPIPSPSCHRQVLHEPWPETLHIFTILNEIFICLLSFFFFL